MREKYLYILIILFVTSIFFVKVEIRAMSIEDKDLEDSLEEVKSGIVRLLVYATDEKGGAYNIKQGTGILIGNDNDEISVLVCDQLLKVDEDSLDKIRRQNGISVETSLKIEVDIVLEVGTRIKTVADSVGKDIVILKLDKEINNVKKMRLGDSSTVKKNDQLFIIGHDRDFDILGYEGTPNTKLKSKIIKVDTVTDKKITANMKEDNISIGSPVFNLEGYVEGILLKEGNDIYVKPINAIKNILDVLNVSYQGRENTNHYNEVTEEIRIELNDLLLECEEIAMQPNKYTKKSLEKLKNSIAEAIEVTLQEKSTYDDYSKAIEKLTKYKKKVRKINYPFRVVQFSFLIGIIFFSLMNIKAKFKINKFKQESSTYFQQNSSENNIIYAKMIRLDNKQEIPITKVIFRIGQEIENIDYVIDDNTSISRHHADIMIKGNEFYVLDNNSTNYTYVNNQRVMPGEYRLIKTGDTIQLSDLIFRFEV